MAIIFLTSLRSEHMRAGRTLLGWTQPDLAKASGLSPQTVRNMEKICGDVKCKPLTKKAILDAFSNAGVEISGNQYGYGVFRVTDRYRQRKHELQAALIGGKTQAERDAAQVELYRLSPMPSPSIDQHDIDENEQSLRDLEDDNPNFD